MGNTGPAVLQIAAAKAVCRRCDVIETCLRWALDTGQEAGVWGGQSEDERKSAKRRTARMHRRGEDDGTDQSGRPPAYKYVDAGPARAMLQPLEDAGRTVAHIARLVGLTENVVRSILGGQPLVRDSTAATITAAFEARAEVNA